MSSREKSNEQNVKEFQGSDPAFCDYPLLRENQHKWGTPTDK